jgi:hypothetical protein
MSGRLERIYARYSEVRPSIAAPKNEEELWEYMWSAILRKVTAMA